VRDKSLMRFGRYGATPRAAVWLARLGGLLAVMVLVTAGWGVQAVLAASDTETRDRAFARTPRARVTAPATVASAADVVSVRRVRTIAVGQLREADQMLSACPSPALVSRSARAVAAWSACARWHVAHLDINGRTNARILYTTAQQLPSGRCRRTATGRANAMMLLADAAQQLLLNAWDRSRPGRTATMHRITQLRILVRDINHDLRRSAPGCGRVTAAGR